MTVAEHKSDFKLTTDTPYFTLAGELWGIYCDNLGENWPRYNGIILNVYLIFPFSNEATEWVGPKEGVRNVLVKLDEVKNRVDVQNDSKKIVRTIDFSVPMRRGFEVKIQQGMDPKAHSIAIKVPNEYDLVSLEHRNDAIHTLLTVVTLQWRHGILNHRKHDCLFNNFTSTGHKGTVIGWRWGDVFFLS